MATKLALGKGLKALIPDNSESIIINRQDHSDTYQFSNSITGQSGVIGNIPVDKISTNPFQPRKYFDEEALHELKQSILENGLIQPITVRIKEDGFELISGERRLRATMEAGLSDIPAYILNVETNQQMAILALTENVLRKDLNPIEIALSYQLLVEEHDLTQEEVAQKMGKDRSTITNMLRLLRLPEDIQISVKKGELSMGHARTLLAMTNEDEQRKLWRRILGENLSVRMVEDIVAHVGPKKPSKTTESLPKNIEVSKVEQKLREKLGTKISLKHTKKGSGVIAIEYFSVDDLERLVELIESIRG